MKIRRTLDTSWPRVRKLKTGPELLENRLWGAERIRGKLLKPGIAVAKRTIQRYLSKTDPSVSDPLKLEERHKY